MPTSPYLIATTTLQVLLNSDFAAYSKPLFCLLVVFCSGSLQQFSGADGADV